MFWGLILEPNKRYSQTVKQSFHISCAALDLSTSSGASSQVICEYEGRKYLLCTLTNPNIVQFALDLNFAANTEIAFATNGAGNVHLTGYIIENDDDSLTLDQLDQEESEDEVFSEENSKKSKKKSQLELQGTKKKAKLMNGSANEEELLEEESDDPDYDEAQDEEGEEEEEDAEDGSDVNSDEEEDSEPEVKVVAQVKSPKKEKKSPEKQPEKAERRTLKSGVITEDLVQGTGPAAKPGRLLTVYYEGRLKKNNKVFDSVNKGPGFRFRLGQGEVITGWDVGLAGMKVGGKRKIICPPQAAYGVKGSPPVIPPNSTLVFTVTLKQVK